MIRNDGTTTYAKAQADTEANAEVCGIVTAVADANNFSFVPAGYVTGLSGLTAETVYYLSPSSAGAMTATEPTTVGHVSKPVLIATDTDEGVFSHAYRGVIVAAAISDSDPVFETFGAPDTAFEFATSSLAGLTAMGTSPTVEDADTSVADAYYLALAAASGVNWRGRYLAASPPFTAIGKLVGFAGYAQFNAAGLVIGASTPGEMIVFGPRMTTTHAAQLQATSWTSPTGTGADLGAAVPPIGYVSPLWLALVVNSSDDVDCFFSTNGYVWSRLVLNLNPSFTVGAIGLVGSSEGTGAATAAAWDYLRIFNSALTLPGTG